MIFLRLEMKNLKNLKSSQYYWNLFDIFVGILFLDIL